MIGTAAVLLWWLNGRIAGVSGVAGGVLAPGPISGGRGWRLLILLGLVLGTAAWFGLPHQVLAVHSDMHPGLLVVVGLLVGWGTTMAGGCTSGHGVCGLARLSLRSAVAVAVAVFLAATVATTALVRHGPGWVTWARTAA